MSNELIDDIYFDQNEINIVSKSNINNLKLKNKDICLDIIAKNNKINVREIIENNKLFLNNSGKYILCTENEENILINNWRIKDKIYICRNININVYEETYIVNVYAIKDRTIVISILKEVNSGEEGTIKVEENGIYISEKILNLELVSNIYRVDSENNLKLEPYNAQKAKLILYGKNKSEVFEFEAKEIFNNKISFALDLNKILDEDNYNLNTAIVIDSKLFNLEIKPKLKFKNIIIKNDAVIKGVSVVSDKNKNLRIKSSSNLSIKPKARNISYENGLVIECDMNANIDIFSHNRTDAKAILLSDDGKIRQEYKINVESDMFKIFIDNEELQILKDNFIGRWNIFVEVDFNNKEIANTQIVSISKEKAKKVSLFTQSIEVDEETLVLDIYKPKKLNYISMEVKNNISVTKLISVVRRNNKLKVRFRTKENIEALLSKKLLDVNIETPSEVLYQSKIKKNGKKTFTVEYNSENGVKFAEDMYKKGITVKITSDGKKSVSLVSDIDKDIIYSTLWQQVQASKKYKKIVRGIYKLLLSKLPIKKDWIVYESFLGRNMSDSPKYIYEYLEENYPKKYKSIWVFNEKRDDLPEHVVQVKRFSFKHLYYIGRSKYWVNNMRQPKWFIKRDNQVFLATWHGTPLKKLVFDMDEVHSANKDYKQDFYIQSRSWDYLVSANKYSTEIFRRAFKFDNPILELGYPRNDLLYHPKKDEIARQIKEKLGIPLDKKIVLYAPTWRDDEFFKPGKYKFNLELDLRRLRKELGDQYYFVLRTHYFIANHIDVEGLEDFVYNASKYDDITELYLLSDVLITDYSSVFFDYANLKRPTLFFTYDLEKYRDTLRGFYLDLHTEGPGPIVMNNDEIINELKDFNKLNKKYKDRIQQFHARFCTWDDGEAAKRIAEEVIVLN